MTDCAMAVRNKILSHGVGEDAAQRRVRVSRRHIANPRHRRTDGNCTVSHEETK